MSLRALADNIAELQAAHQRQTEILVTLLVECARLLRAQPRDHEARKRLADKRAGMLEAIDALAERVKE